MHRLVSPSQCLQRSCWTLLPLEGPPQATALGGNQASPVSIIIVLFHNDHHFCDHQVLNQWDLREDAAIPDVFKVVGDVVHHLLSCDTFSASLLSYSLSTSLSNVSPFPNYVEYRQLCWISWTWMVSQFITKIPINNSIIIIITDNILIWFKHIIIVIKM